MACKTSPEMHQARILVEKQGMTPYAAAKQAGVHRNSIYSTSWYKKLKKEGLIADPWWKKLKK